MCVVCCVHAECIDVHALSVVLLVQFGSNELWRAQDTLHHRRMPSSRQSEVAQPHLARTAIHKDVVALQVAVDDGRGQVVQVVQSVQQLTAPAHATAASKQAQCRTMFNEW